MSRTIGDRVGIGQWFHLHDEALLRATVEMLGELGIRHLRTGISWANYHRPGGRRWYDLQMRVLREAGIEPLVSVWHTPPSLSLDPDCSSCTVPPRHPKLYADFIDQVIDRYGAGFQALELWNEPNNPYKWDPAYDPEHARFAELIAYSGNWTRECGKTAVLGGVTMIDHAFMESMRHHGAFEYVDVLGIHAFPDMWEPFATSWDQPDHWYGWDHRVARMSELAGGLPVWITETGLATYRKDTGERGRYDLQSERLRDAAASPAQRMYWYSLFDLPGARVAIEEANGGPREEAEYHMGLIRHRPGWALEGAAKPALSTLRELMAGWALEAVGPDADAGRGSGA